MGNSAFLCGKQQIPWQMENSATWRENPCAAEYDIEIDVDETEEMTKKTWYDGVKENF